MQEERTRPMSPKYLFADMSKYSSAEHSPNEGITTEKLLAERSKYCNFWQFEKLISPVILFPLRANTRIPSQPVDKIQGRTFGPEIPLFKEISRTWRLSLKAVESLPENSKTLSERLRYFKLEQELR